MSCRPPRSTPIDSVLPGAPLTAAMNSRSVGKRLAVDRHHFVAGAQARAFAGAAGGRRLHQGVRPPGRQIEPQARQQAAGLGELPRVRRNVNRQRNVGAAPAHHDRDGRVAGDGAQQIDLQFLGIGDLVIADPHDLIAASEAGRGGRTVEPHLSHDGLDDLGARHRENRVQQRGEDEIHGGAGEQHRDPVRDGTAREGAMQLRGIDLALALVEELHITAEWNRG